MSATPEAEWHNTRPAPAASHGLSRNPFWVLGATTRDDRRRIVELCDALALELGGDDAQKARAALTNPRARLSQEVAWLPGVAPKKARTLPWKSLPRVTSILPPLTQPEAGSMDASAGTSGR